MRIDILTKREFGIAICTAQNAQNGKNHFAIFTVLRVRRIDVN